MHILILIIPHIIHMLYTLYTTVYSTLYNGRVEGLWHKRGGPVPVQGDGQVQAIHEVPDTKSAGLL